MKTIEDIKKANKRAGRYFFSPDTMRFFNSRICKTVYKNKYFITSERYKNENRRYTIRQANNDGSIDTVGKFQAYATRAEAIKAVKELD